MSLQLSSPVAWSLVTSVILWSMFLFCGFGVLSETKPTTIIALAFGSISVASAMFLILGLTQPYSGLFFPGFASRSNRRSRRSTNSTPQAELRQRSPRRDGKGVCQLRGTSRDLRGRIPFGTDSGPSRATRRRRVPSNCELHGRCLQRALNVDPAVLEVRTR
jgi:hypothetical protein